jgi:rhomboid family GlyGly-CTERM serine protease
MHSIPMNEETGLGGPQPTTTRLHLAWATLSMAAAAVAVQAWPAAQDALVYDRTAVQAGEVWRLWTAHVVHFGASHLWWNLVIFVAAGLWLERVAPWRLRVLLALGPLVIGATLLAGDAALARYAGLSGLGAGVVALLALTQLRRMHGEAMFWRAVLAALVLKIGLEIVADRPLFARFDDETIHSVPLAHLAGAALAVAIHACTHARDRSSWPVSPPPETAQHP